MPDSQKISSLPDQVRESVTLESNKPDFKELDIGSPITTLRTTKSGPARITTSSSSSSSGSVTKRHDIPTRKSHSGELSVSSDGSLSSKPCHGRSDSIGTLHLHSNSQSQPLIYSGSISSVSSPPAKVYPTGNICPSGKIIKTGMAKTSTRSDVLGSGSGNYGHGSIMRGGFLPKNKSESTSLKQNVDAEALKNAGNDQHRKGNFSEALSFYDKAILLSKDNAAYKSNKAAALTGLGRFSEAVRECEEAIVLDHGYGRAHQRLGSILIRLGAVEIARRHVCIPGQPTDSIELLKLQTVEKHINKCYASRKLRDWKTTLQEANDAILAGADQSPHIFACRAEALLKLNQLNDADSMLSSLLKFETLPHSCSRIVCFEMFCEAYLFFVRAQIEIALGRFENAITTVEKARQIDPQNTEIFVLLNSVKLASRARARGNDLYKSDRFTEACAAYDEGLRLIPINSVLFCNRAACSYKLGLWDRCIEDCNHALHIQPNYTKALLRRASANSKLERWIDAVKDYEALKREAPDDSEVAESLVHAQASLRKSRGEEDSGVICGKEAVEVSGLDQFKAAISSPGVSVVHFKAQCDRISPFVNVLCARYPSVNFVKVDIEGSVEVGSVENIRVVPTFKIYKNGVRVMEMMSPSHQVLESSVRHYSF